MDQPEAGPEPRSTPDAEPRREPSGTGGLVRALAVYTALRLLLVAALTAVLMIFMPLIVALLFAVIAQLPLSWLLFAGPRRRVNEAIAAAGSRRRADRARLEAALQQGEDPPQDGADR